MAAAEHKTLDSLCRYMTDANGLGETWHVVDRTDGYLEVVADFPAAADETDDYGMWSTGYIVTGGLDEPSVLASLIHGANTCIGSTLDVPLLRGLDESASAEAIRLRLAAYGY